MARCEQCGGEWNPPGRKPESLAVCPFCGAPQLEESKARACSRMDEFLSYMVSVYGKEIYRTPDRLKNLMGDLFSGEERIKRLFRRVLVEDKLSVKVYEIAQKPANERPPFYTRLACQFAEADCRPMEFGLEVVAALVAGLTGEKLTTSGVRQPLRPESTDKAGQKTRKKKILAQVFPVSGSRDKIVQLGQAKFEMVYVEGGTFRMGATEEQGEDAKSNERPVHEVSLADFMIGQCTVTQALWMEVMGKNPSLGKRGGNYPVNKVSWVDCQKFIRRLNSQTGLKFRLPTEAEWEYAARGGKKSKGYRYAGSDNPDRVGWYKENSWEKCDAEGNRLWHVHEAGGKKANELGIFDMSGNLWEWCQDWAGDYDTRAWTDPKGSLAGSARVVRGGCFRAVAGRCRVSARWEYVPDQSRDFLGLRLVLSL